MRPQPADARIWAIGTALPEHRCTREQSLDIARTFFPDPRTAAFAERIINGSGIDCRHTVIAGYDFAIDATTSVRNQIFEQQAPALALAACRSLSPAPWSSQVTHLITATCTGFSAPGFDIALARTLGLSPRVERSHIGFMGCYAGFSTLKLAKHICTANPSALILIVHVELCSLHLRFCDDPEVIVANCIFADGAAAALVAGEGHAALGSGPALGLVSAGSWLLPDGASDMTWSIGDHGFRMTLSPRVPHLVSKHLPSAFAALLEESSTPRSSIRHWAIHPGGLAILNGVEKTLDLRPEDLTVARNLLRNHGNMSSATLWFLLDAIRRRPAPGLVYACGFGPGLTLESALLSHQGA